MFTIQTAATIVTAGIASCLFGDFISTELWTIIMLFICALNLIKGKYRLLDQLMRVIVITLTISMVVAVFLALNANGQPPSFTETLPKTLLKLAFNCFYGLDASTFGYSGMAITLGTRKTKSQ